MQMPYVTHFSTGSKKTIKLFGKKIEAPMPSISVLVEATGEFDFQFHMENKNNPWYKVSWPEDKRHLSLAELTQILACENVATSEITAGIILSALGERHKGFWTCDGLRREGEQLIVAKNIDHVVEEVTGWCTIGFETVVGYCLPAEFPAESFTIERLFRKYAKSKEESMRVPLRHLEKANPDVIDYLFCNAYENLPEVIKNAAITLPPDRQWISQKPGWEGVTIWPVDVGFRFARRKDEHEANSWRMKEVCINEGIYRQSILVKELK